jgi:hypothetical protein
LNDSSYNSSIVSPTKATANSSDALGPGAGGGVTTGGAGLLPLSPLLPLLPLLPQAARASITNIVETDRNI